MILGVFLRSPISDRNAVLRTGDKEENFKYFEMTFEDPDLVNRILKFHGEERAHLKIELFEGVWKLRGMHPRVASDTPQQRGMSTKHDTREPEPIEMLNARALVPDGVEMLRKGSQSISQKGSFSDHATIGDVSIMSRLEADGQFEDALKEEMLVNSHSMDKLRFLQLCSLLCEQVLSRLSTIFQDDAIKGDVAVNSRTTLDSSLDVCHVFTYN